MRFGAKGLNEVRRQGFELVHSVCEGEWDHQDYLYY